MTAGQQLHVNKTLAELGHPFVYGVVHNSEPDVYGYGTNDGDWEIFERLDPRTGITRWSATWWEKARAFPAHSKDWTAGRLLPLGDPDWDSLANTLAWLVAQTLTHGEHNPDEGDAK